MNPPAGLAPGASDIGGRGDGHGRAQGADQVIHTGEDGGLGANRSAAENRGRVTGPAPGAEPGRPTERSR